MAFEKPRSHPEDYIERSVQLASKFPGRETEYDESRAQYEHWATEDGYDGIDRVAEIPDWTREDIRDLLQDVDTAKENFLKRRTEKQK